MSESLETLIDGEGMDLNLSNRQTLVYCAFPDSLQDNSE